MGGQLSILSIHNPNDVFSLATERNVALWMQYCHWLIQYKFKLTSILTNFWTSLWFCLLCRVLGCCFQLGISQFCTFFGLKCLFVIITMPIFSVGKVIYWVGNFGQWADLIYWGNFLKNRYFANICLIWEFFCNMLLILWVSSAQQISFLPNRFLVKYKFPFPIFSRKCF